MTQDFIDELKSLFPAITPEEVVKIENIFKDSDKYIKEIFAPSMLDVLSQADLLTNIPFVVFKEENEIEKKRTFGMIISPTCDYAQKKHILIAPAYELSFYEKAFDNNTQKLRALKSNAIYQKFYIPKHIENPELVIDLSQINAYSEGFLRENLDNNAVKRIASLSSIGYRFFLMKMTLFLLRPESEEEIVRVA